MICVLGDAHLDVVVRLLGPVAPDTDTPSRTSVGVGGQAANVAAWVAALGGQSRLLFARGTDLAADLVTAELAGRGVELAGPVVAGGTGVVVALSDGGATRSMLTDRGVGPRFAAADLRESWLDGCSWLHLPAYSLVGDPISGAALGVRAGGRHHPAAATDAVDSTGAGDAFAAGYLLGGVPQGLAAAARAVATMGGMP